MMKGVDSLVGRWRGGVAAKVGVDEVASMGNDLGSGAGMMDNLGTSAMVREDDGAVFGMVAVVGGHIGKGAGDAAAREDVVSHRVHEVTGKTAVGMVAIMAGLVVKGRDGIAAEAGAVRAGV